MVKDLNQRFGIENRVVFDLGNGGLPRCASARMKRMRKFICTAHTSPISSRRAASRSCL